MTLIPVRWFYPTAASGPVPCEWVGVDWLGRQIRVVMIGEG